MTTYFCGFIIKDVSGGCPAVAAKHFGVSVEARWVELGNVYFSIKAMGETLEAS